MDVDEVILHYRTREKGLTEEEAARRLSSDGPNEIPRIKRSFLRKVAPQIFDFVILLLLGIALLMAVLSWLFPGNEGTSFETSIAIVFVIVLSWVLIIFQMYSAERSLEALRRIAAAKAHVMRGGRWVQVPTKDLVVGDLVRMNEGDRAPADIRIIKSDRLSMDESSLTGESVSVDKDIMPVEADVLSLHRMSCMAFMSTVVTRGACEGIVTAVGTGTELGKIAKGLEEAPEPEIPLQRKMSQLARTLSIILFTLIITLFIVQIMRLWSGGDLNADTAVTQLVNAVILSVVAVPWSFPIITTSVMARGMIYLVKENAIVRRVASIEGLGRVSVICSDKTGTMTQNAMTVRTVYHDGKLLTVTGTGYGPDGSIMDGDEAIEIVTGTKLAFMLISGYLNNDSKVVVSEGSWRVIGDPTEGALKTLAEKAGVVEGLDGSRPLRDIPFTSERKLMTKVFTIDGSVVSLTKGSFETVFGGCDRIVVNGKVERMDPSMARAVKEYNESTNGLAQRTLAFAYKEIRGDLDEVSDEGLEEGMVFLGFVGMIDPPKEGVREAVAKCLKAGIKVVMITGDSKGTATAIARDLGVLGPKGIVVEGSELPLGPDRINEVSVFCRVSPQQKVDIVRAYRESGRIVAMTGDGMNDAAALKHADVGVAMGLSGVDVAKEASQIVLADDNFATLVTAVHRGRQIFDNIRKSITYQIYTNLGELSVMFLGSLIFLEQMMTDKHLLFLYFSTHLFPVAALVLDRTSPEVMKEPPRGAKEGIVSSKVLGSLAVMILSMAFIALTMFLVLDQGWLDLGIESDRMITIQTMVLVFMVWGECFNLFNSLSLKGSILRTPLKSLPLPIVLTLVPIGALTFFMYVGGFSAGLDLARLTGAQYGFSVACGLMIVPVVESFKMLLRSPGWIIDKVEALRRSWEGSILYKLLETNLDRKTRATKIFQFFFPAVLFLTLMSISVSMLYLQKGWEVAEELLSGWIFYLLPPLGKEIIIPTRVASGVPASYIGFATFMVDLCVCLFLTWNYDWVKRIPWVGKAMLRTEQKGRDKVKRSRWFRRTVFLMVTFFVFVPLQGSGGVGGTLLGRVVGLHPYLVVLSVGLGSFIGSFAYAIFSEAMVGIMEESTIFIFISEVNILHILAIGIALGLLIYVIRNPRKATEETSRLLSDALDMTGKGILFLGDSGEEATHLTFRGVRDTLKEIDKAGSTIEDIHLTVITKPIEIMGPTGRNIALNAKALGKKRMSMFRFMTGRAVDLGLKLGEDAASMTFVVAGNMGREGMGHARNGVLAVRDLILKGADRISRKETESPPSHE